MTVVSAVNGSPSVIFPSQGHQILSTLVHLLGCSVLAFCLGRRLSWNSMTISKFCTMAIFADSWLFVFSGGVVVSGIGMSENRDTCLSGIYLCILFYGSSKVLIYTYLAEKVHVVWSAGIAVSRFKSRIWILCAAVLFGYVAIFILMIVGKIAYIRPDRTCIIGLKGMASIPLLTYDVFLNIFLTGLFVYPLLRRTIMNAGLRALAKRTCFAAAIALGTSVVNILILTLLHGQQLGWVCLASCGLDVTVNAVVIFFISSKSSSNSLPSSNVKQAVSTAGPPTSLSVHPEPIAAVVGTFPSVRSKRRGPPPVPARKKASRSGPLSTQSESRVGTLSAIGDFAATRDDGGHYTTVGSIPQRDAFSRASYRRGETGNTVAVVSSFGVPTSEDETPYGLGYQSNNLMQMMPTLSKGESFASTTSLEELKEETESPVKPRMSLGDERV